MSSPRRRERAMVTAFVTIFTLTIIFVIGLVLDGGNVLVARRQAANEAEAAARAGAQEINEAHLRRTGEAVLDREQASAAAHAYLDRIGREGTVSVGPDSVQVTVHIDRPLYILGIGGIGPDVTVSGDGSARNVRGVVTAEN